MAKKKNSNHSSHGRGRGNREPSDFTVSEWNGLITSIKDITELPDGATPDSLNWITGRDKDHIELRRGYAVLGTTKRNGTGRISGLGVVARNDGKQVPFFSFNQKILYYDSTAQNTIEIGTNTLPAVSSGEDVSFMPYQNLAGAHMYVMSPTSSIYKIEAPNPGDVTDLKIKPTGYGKIDTNRMYIWNRRDILGSKYQTDLLIGRVDQGFALANSGPFAQTTKELIAAGNGSTKTFSGTLAFKAANPLQTALITEFAAIVAPSVAITAITQASSVVITAVGNTFVRGDYVFIDGAGGMTEINNLFGTVISVSGSLVTVSINSSTFTAYTSGGSIYKAEHFIDDINGNLNSNLGGTGTINYTTGAYNITFNTAPVTTKNFYAQYYTEDATNKGVADLTVTNTKGDGKIFPQFDGGGDLESVFPFDQVQYCFHQIKTWYLNLGTDDSSASNLPYRSTFGIPYWRAGYPTPDGIIVMDTGTPSNPQMKILQIDVVSTSVVTVVPISISDSLDLTPYGYGLSVVFRFGDYDILCCENVANGVVDPVNTLFFIRNKISQQWDLLNYPISVLAEYNGTLLGGSSLSNNVLTLFSGFDDDSSLINNYWKSKQFNLRVEGIKKFNRFVIRGLIQQTQNIDIYFSFDSGSFIKVFTVKGNGSYVNSGAPITIGSSTIGSQVVGGGSGLGPVVTAYPFEVEFEYSTDYFEYVQTQFAANNIGFAQIDTFTFKDIRYKGLRLPASRIVAST